MRAVFLCLPLALCGCQALEPLAADGRCGNHIVEPQADEDCDGRATPAGLRCGEVGEPGACRFRCDDSPCPDGWACGQDRLCRVGDGRLRLHAALGFAGQSFAGDTDGDGRSDLLSFGAADLVVAFGDDGGRFSAQRVLNSPVSDVLPAVGRLDGDASDDVVLPLIGGTQLMLGGDRRGLTALPVTLATLAGERGVQALGLRAAPPYNTDELLVAGLGDDDRIFARFQGRETQANLTDLPSGLPLMRDQAVLRREGQPDRWGVALDGARFVWLAQADCVDEACTVDIVDAVRLPQASTLTNTGVHLADADADGDQDLWAVVSRDGRSHLALALQGADGRFEPFAVVDGAERAVECPSCPPGSPSANLNAVADLDGDGVGDLVTSRGVFVLKLGEPATLTTVIAPIRPWNRSIVADFNGDGEVDVAANRPGSLDIYVNTGGGIFNLRGLAIEEVDGLTVGDFDGDLAPDVAYVTNETTIIVLFSGPQRLPTEPVLMGRLAADTDATLVISDMKRARLTQIGGDGGTDFLDDLVFVVAAPDGPAADATMFADRMGVMQGSSSRRMASGVPQLGRVFSGVTVADLGQGPEVWVAEIIRGGSSNAQVRVSVVDAAEVLAGAEATATLLDYEDGCNRPQGYAKHMFTAPLGPDGQDRVVLLDTTTPERSQSSWAMVVMHREGATVRCFSPAVVEVIERTPGAPAVADLDGDGLVDVASLLIRRSGNIANAGDGLPPELVVWWGQAGAAPLSEPVRFELDLPPVSQPSLTAGRLGPAQAAQLLLTSTAGVDQLRFSRERALTVVAPEDGGLVVEQARQLVVMDANGDGLDDLLLVEETETLVALQGVCSARDAALGRCAREAP